MFETMTRRGRVAAAITACVAFGLTACTPPSDDATETATTPIAAGKFDFADWDQYLGGADSSQYSSLDEINEGNVGRLEVAWTYPTSENYLFNPLVVGNTMYVLAKGRSIIALDATTGRELWAHANEGPVGTPGTGENICRKCNGTGRLKGESCPNCLGTGRINEGVGGG